MVKKENLVIIGGGIASHTAAIYTARAGLKPIIIHSVEPDQLSLTTLVENYPGFPKGILGPDLIKNCKEQAKKFGATYIQGTVDNFNVKNGCYGIGFGKEKINAKTVIIATGAHARRLGIKGENEYFGKGVGVCAVCDAPLYKNKEVIVVGGGDTAMEESLALYKFAKKITLVHRRNEFRASKIMQDRVLKLKDKINIILDSQVTEVLGDGKFVTGAKIKNVKTNKESTINCNGVFLAIGYIPNTKIFEGKIKLDKLGFIETKNSKTSLQGVFAAGDVQDPIYKQAITSAGVGCMAALEAEKYIESLRK